jgi:hypothetical protein
VGLRRKIYFSHRQTTFNAWLLVDSRSLPPPPPPPPPVGAPPKICGSEGVNSRR